MTLQQFETDDAIYYLGLGIHDTSSYPLFKDVDLSSLDFFVFEEGAEVGNLHYDIDRHVQYKKLYKNLIKENPKVGVYGVDLDLPEVEMKIMESALLFEAMVGSVLAYSATTDSYSKIRKKEFSRRDFLKNSGILLGSAVLALPPITALTIGVSKSSITEDINSINSTIIPLSKIAFRDAIAAKRITEYLVPKYKEGNKKVKAGILYGGLHSGIEYKIKYPGISDATIELYHDLLGYASKKEINEIRQIVSTYYGLRSIRLDSKLF